MKDFNDIEEYRRLLIGRKIETVDFSDADEGLKLGFGEGKTLDFRFSGCEGTFKIDGDV